MGLGYVEGVTHDYVRHGTTTLFAARIEGLAEGGIICYYYVDILYSLCYSYATPVIYD